MTSDTAIDVTAGFAGEVLGPVPVNEAVSRVLAYCTFKSSGWAVYDLAGISARAAGLMNEITAWSLLFVNALNGRVDVKDVAEFDRTRRRAFADLIGRIPSDRELHSMSEGEVDDVIRVCRFGFNGAWAPKITKLAALYRPQAVPVLDGYVGMAFGYRRDDLSLRVNRFGLSREERIAAIVRAMAAYLRDHQPIVARLRAELAERVPELAAADPETGSRPLISDLRLLDMIIWTAMDDRLAARTGLPPKWLGMPIGNHIPYEAVAPEPIPPQGMG
ncbi:DUF6308 family protein [Micromonospora haikouensis]|uniref:DUF6308 family protein n=1 Tax=Micromonospora haikouensis TaxID=686309 RepID=UPI0033BFCFA6